MADADDLQTEWMSAFREINSPRKVFEPAQAFVVMSLATRADSATGGKILRSRAGIVRDTGVSKNTVDAALDRAVALNVLTRETTYFATDQKSRSVYALVPPTEWRPAGD